MKAYQYSNKSIKENGIHQTNEEFYEKIVSLATLSHAITGSIESPLQLFFQVHPKLDLVNFAVRPHLFTKSCSSLNRIYSKK